MEYIMNPIDIEDILHLTEGRNSPCSMEHRGEEYETLV